MFDFTWSFKVNEILPALEAAIERSTREVAEGEEALSAPVVDQDKTDAIQALAREMGVTVVIQGAAGSGRLRREGRSSGFIGRETTWSERSLEAAKSELVKYRRLHSLMQREGPHRQYKLNYSEVAELGLVPVDGEP